MEGRLLLDVTAINSRTQDPVLHAEAEVEQAPTVYVFTGQGSQSIGMGMESYKSSAAAKKVWDNADRFLLDKFGKFDQTLLPFHISLLTKRAT